MWISLRVAIQLLYLLSLADGSFVPAGSEDEVMVTHDCDVDVGRRTIYRGRLETFL